MCTAKTKSVPAVERALTIFEIMGAARKGLTLSEIARSLELPKSSVHYVLSTLERRGYLYRRGERGRYMFTSKLFSLASSAQSGLGLGEESRPFLRQLMESTGLTVHMALLEQNELVLIEKAEPTPFRLPSWVGKRMAIHCTGLGKALLAHLPEERINQIIRQGLMQYNDNTIVSSRKLLQELARIRQLGYSLDDEEETVGLRCVGAAVLGSGQAIAAISIAGGTHEITSDNLESLAAKLKGTAEKLSRHLMAHAPEMEGSGASDDVLQTSKKETEVSR